MDLFVLDSQLRRSKVIDFFESLIWTERFSAIGDFEVVVHATNENRALLTEDTWLAINDSQRVMVVETVIEKEDDEGRLMLTVSGQSLESILDHRLAWTSLANLEDVPYWRISGTPGDIARSVFKTICVDGALDTRDIIPFITSGSIFPVDTIQEPLDVITLMLEPATVLSTIQDICTTYGIGYALVRDLDTSRLYFQVYAGSNRTSRQKNLPPVIFNPALDSLTNVSELTSIAQYKNVAYVLSPLGVAVVYADGADSTTVGFDRRVLMVKIDNVREDPSEDALSVLEILQRRGKDALATYRRIGAFDGEISTTEYQYNTHYRLGDIIEMQKANGAINYMRITEQIFVSDAEGDRAYPTLSLDTFISPGSWYSWEWDIDWDEAEGTWDDQ